MQLIYRDGALAKMLLHEFNSSDGWNLCVDKDRAKTYYKRSGQVSQKYFGTSGTNSGHVDGATDDAPLHVIKIEGEIDAPIFNLLSILYEIDLYKEWVPQLDNCGVIKYLGDSHDEANMKLSRFRFLSYFSFSLPWPLSSRDSITYAFVVDRSDYEADPSILVVIRGATKDHDNAEIISKYDNSEHVRVDIDYSGFLIRMTSEHSCHISLIAVSKKRYLNSISYYLILSVERGSQSFFCSILVTKLVDDKYELFISKLRQAAAKVPNSVYSERIKNNDQIYGEITRKLSKFIKK